MNKGYIIGGGPGDIGLITKKAYDLIGIADVILYDRLVNKRLLESAKEGCELIYVGKSSTSGGESQKDINKIFAEKVKENPIVLRLHGGDPFLFGRGSEEIDLLIKEGLDYEVIPGISSSFAVPAYGGFPLTKRGVSSSLHIYTARSSGGKVNLDFATMARLKGTINILMGVGVIDQISKGLIDAGMDKDTPVAVVQEGTTQNQRSVSGALEDIPQVIKEKGIKAPSIISIGGTASLLGKYDWFTDTKLFGERVILTRDADAFPRSAKVFEREGAEVLSLPMIELKTSLDIFDDDFLQELKGHDFVSFNSPMAVKAFFEGMEKLGRDSRVLGSNSILAMGSGTVEELGKYNLKPDYIPSKYSVETLLKEIGEVFGRDKKVLLLSSDIHKRDKKELSAKYMLDIEIKSIYTNKGLLYNEEEIKKYLAKESYIVFLSSSAVDNFYLNTQSLDTDSLKFVSIGPTTSKTLYKYGYDVAVEAEEYSLEGILEKLIKTK